MRRGIRQDLTRRGLFGLTLTAAAAASLPAWAQDAAAPAEGAAATGPWMGEKVYGDPNAPVTLIEYASLACGACANFHKTVFPELKEQFIDPGQVKLIFRDFPLNLPGVRAHALARCAGERRFTGLVDVLFKTQANWLSQNPEPQLRRIASMAGVAPAQFDACMADKGLETFLIQSQAKAGSEHNITSTPTFIIEKTGARVVGVDKDALFTALEKAGATRKPAS